RLTPWEMGRVALGMRCGAAGSMSGEWRRSRVGDSGAGNRKVRPHAWPTYPTAPLLDTTRFPPFLPLWTGATASHRFSSSFIHYPFHRFPVPHNASFFVLIRRPKRPNIGPLAPIALPGRIVSVLSAPFVGLEACIQKRFFHSD